MEFIIFHAIIFLNFAGLVAMAKATGKTKKPAVPGSKPSCPEIDHLKKENRRLNDQLEQYYSQWSSITGAARVAYFIHDYGVLLDGNDRYFKMFGYKREELIGKPAIELTVAPEAQESLLKQIRNQVTDTYRSIGLKKNGQKFPIELIPNNIIYQGRPTRAVVIYDISSQVITEKELVESERRLQHALENIQMISIIIDTGGKLLFINDFTLKMLEWDKEKVLGKNWFYLTRNKSKTRLKTYLREVSTRTVPPHHISQIKTSSDKLLTISWNNTILRNPEDNRKIIGVLTIGEDITSSLKAKKQLEESRERLRMALLSSETGTWRWYPDTNLDTRDASLSRILGLEEKETTQPVDDFLSRIHKDDRKKVKDGLDKAIRDNDIYAMDFRIVRPDGSIRWIRDRGRPYYDDQGKLLYATGAVTDITDRVENEEKVRKLNLELEQRVKDRTRQLAESESRMMTMMENFPEGGIFLIDRDYRITLAKGAVLRGDNILSEEMVGKTISEVLPEKSREIITEQLDKIFSGKQARFEFQLHPATYMIYGVPLDQQNGNVPLAMLLGVDISERKRAEKQILIQRDLALDIAFSVNLEEAATHCIKAAMEISGMDCGALYIHIPDENRFETISRTSIREQCDKLANLIAEKQPFYKKLIHGESIYTENFGKILSEVNRGGKDPIKSVAIIPLMSPEMIIGCMSLCSFSEPEIPQYIRESITDLAALIANSISQKQAELALRESEARLRDAQKIASIGSWELDLVRKRLYWSDELYNLFELDPETFTPTVDSFAALLHPDDRVATKQKVVNSIETGGSFTVEYRYITPGGDMKYFQAFGKADYDGKGNISRLTGTAQDITERVNRAKELEIAKTRAEDASRAKSEFLANMSHEIRTPMNSILGFTELLESQTTSQKETECLKAISSSGNTLMTLINDILDLSKVEAGKLDLKFTPVEIEKIFTDIKQIFAIRAKEKDIYLHFIIEPDVPSIVFLDEVRLRQILTNLTSNAIKFTEHGYVKVTVHAERFKDTAKTVALSFSVEDSGIGIIPEKQKSIFDAFVQEHGQEHSIYGGTGLGLTITQRLVKLMGGDISMTSELDKGSTFTVYFPEIRIGSEEESAAFAQPHHPNLALTQFDPAIILLVDDNVLNRQLIVGYFKSFDFMVLEAGNGQEALEITKQYQPDLIIMDLKMPVMNGDEATILIKQDPLLRNIPVIALTASAMKHVEDEKKQIFDDFLRKPVTRLELLQTLSKYLKSNLKIPEEEQTKQSGEEIPGETLSAESLEKTPHLWKIFEKKLLPQWHRHQMMSVESMQQFGEEIAQLGENFDYPPFRKWGNEICDAAAIFKVDSLERSMASFSGIISILENHVKKQKEGKNA